MKNLPEDLKGQLKWAWEHGIEATARKCKFCGGMAAMVPLQYYCSQSCEYQSKHPPPKSADQWEAEYEALLVENAALIKRIAELEDIIDRNKW